MDGDKRILFIEGQVVENPGDMPSDPRAAQHFADLCTLAFRIALDGDGAAGRCTAQRCRKQKRCCGYVMPVAPDGEGICHGGISGEVAYQAALMLRFHALAGEMRRPG